MNIQGEKTPTKVNPEVLKALMELRRSTFPRQFSGERISDEVVHHILELANTAPNHKRTMPWRFRVFCDDSMKDLLEFKKAYYLANTPGEKIKASKVSAFDERKEQCSHIIAISAYLDQRIALPEWEEISAVACAVQNIYLSLAAYNIGGYWSTGNLVESLEIRRHLELTENERFLGFFYLGVPAVQLPVINREPLGSRVKWIKS